MPLKDFPDVAVEVLAAHAMMGNRLDRECLADPLNFRLVARRYRKWSRKNEAENESNLSRSPTLHPEVSHSAHSPLQYQEGCSAPSTKTVGSNSKPSPQSALSLTIGQPSASSSCSSSSSPPPPPLLQQPQPSEPHPKDEPIGASTPTTGGQSAELHAAQDVSSPSPTSPLSSRGLSQVGGATEVAAPSSSGAALGSELHPPTILPTTMSTTQAWAAYVAWIQSYLVQAVANPLEILLPLCPGPFSSSSPSCASPSPPPPPQRRPSSPTWTPTAAATVLMGNPSAEERENNRPLPTARAGGERYSSPPSNPATRYSGGGRGPTASSCSSSPPSVRDTATALNDLCGTLGLFYLSHEMYLKLPEPEALARIVSQAVRYPSSLIRRLALRLALLCAGCEKFMWALMNDAEGVQWMALCGDRPLPQETAGLLAFMLRIIECVRADREAQRKCAEKKREEAENVDAAKTWLTTKPTAALQRSSSGARQTSAVVRIIPSHIVEPTTSLSGAVSAVAADGSSSPSTVVGGGGGTIFLSASMTTPSGHGTPTPTIKPFAPAPSSSPASPAPGQSSQFTTTPITAKAPVFQPGQSTTRPPGGGTANRRAGAGLSASINMNNNNNANAANASRPVDRFPPIPVGWYIRIHSLLDPSECMGQPGNAGGVSGGGGGAAAPQQHEEGMFAASPRAGRGYGAGWIGGGAGMQWGSAAAQSRNAEEQERRRQRQVALQVALSALLLFPAETTALSLHHTLLRGCTVKDMFSKRQVSAIIHTMTTMFDNPQTRQYLKMNDIGVLFAPFLETTAPQAVESGGGGPAPAAAPAVSLQAGAHAQAVPPPNGNGTAAAAAAAASSRSTSHLSREYIASLNWTKDALVVLLSSPIGLVWAFSETSCLRALADVLFLPDYHVDRKLIVLSLISAVICRLAPHRDMTPLGTWEPEQGCWMPATPCPSEVAGSFSLESFLKLIPSTAAPPLTSPAAPLPPPPNGGAYPYGTHVREYSGGGGGGGGGLMMMMGEGGGGRPLPPQPPHHHPGLLDTTRSPPASLPTPTALGPTTPSRKQESAPLPPLESLGSDGSTNCSTGSHPSNSDSDSDEESSSGSSEGGDDDDNGNSDWGWLGYSSDTRPYGGYFGSSEEAEPGDDDEDLLEWHLARQRRQRRQQRRRMETNTVLKAVSATHAKMSLMIPTDKAVGYNGLDHLLGNFLMAIEWHGLPMALVGLMTKASELVVLESCYTLLQDVFILADTVLSRSTVRQFHARLNVAIGKSANSGEYFLNEINTRTFQTKKDDPRSLLSWSRKYGSGGTITMSSGTNGGGGLLLGSRSPVVAAPNLAGGSTLGGSFHNSRNSRMSSNQFAWLSASSPENGRDVLTLSPTMEVSAVLCGDGGSGAFSTGSPIGLQASLGNVAGVAAVGPGNTLYEDNFVRLCNVILAHPHDPEQWDLDCLFFLLHRGVMMDYFREQETGGKLYKMLVVLLHFFSPEPPIPQAVRAFYPPPLGWGAEYVSVNRPTSTTSGAHDPHHEGPNGNECGVEESVAAAESSQTGFGSFFHLQSSFFGKGGKKAQTTSSSTPPPTIISAVDSDVTPRRETVVVVDSVPAEENAQNALCPNCPTVRRRRGSVVSALWPGSGGHGATGGAVAPEPPRHFTSQDPTSAQPLLCRVGPQLVAVLLQIPEGINILLKETKFFEQLLEMLKDATEGTFEKFPKPIWSTIVMDTLLSMLGQLTMHANGLVALRSSKVLQALLDFVEKVRQNVTGLVRQLQQEAINQGEHPTAEKYAHGLPSEMLLADITGDTPSTVVQVVVLQTLLRKLYHGNVPNFGVCQEIRDVFRQALRVASRDVRLCAIQQLRDVVWGGMFASMQWNIETLLQALRDDDLEVLSTAFLLLVMVCDYSDDSLDYLISLTPVVLMESKVLLENAAVLSRSRLLYRMVSRPSGYRFLQCYGWVKEELQRWENVQPHHENATGVYTKRIAAHMASFMKYDRASRMAARPGMLGAAGEALASSTMSFTAPTASASVSAPLASGTPLRSREFLNADVSPGRGGGGEAPHSARSASRGGHYHHHQRERSRSHTVNSNANSPAKKSARGRSSGLAKGGEGSRSSPNEKKTLVQLDTMSQHMFFPVHFAAVLAETREGCNLLEHSQLWRRAVTKVLQQGAPKNLSAGNENEDSNLSDEDDTEDWMKTRETGTPNRLDLMDGHRRSGSSTRRKTATALSSELDVDTLHPSQFLLRGGVLGIGSHVASDNSRRSASVPAGAGASVGGVGVGSTQPPSGAAPAATRTVSLMEMHRQEADLQRCLRHLRRGQLSWKKNRTALLSVARGYQPPIQRFSYECVGSPEALKEAILCVCAVGSTEEGFKLLISTTAAGIAINSNNNNTSTTINNNNSQSGAYQSAGPPTASTTTAFSSCGPSSNSTSSSSSELLKRLVSLSWFCSTISVRDVALQGLCMLVRTSSGERALREIGFEVKRHPAAYVSATGVPYAVSFAFNKESMYAFTSRRPMNNSVANYATMGGSVGGEPDTVRPNRAPPKRSLAPNANNNNNNNNNAARNHTIDLAPSLQLLQQEAVQVYKIPDRVMELLSCLPCSVSRENAKTALRKILEKKPHYFTCPAVRKYCLTLNMRYRMRAAERQFIAELLDAAHKSYGSSSRLGRAKRSLTQHPQSL